MAEQDGSAPVVLVTGAAGGLGRGLVQAFAAGGWRVAAGWHRQPLGLETESIWPIQLDVTQAVQARQTVERIRARWGRLDVLVNNAGLTADAPLWQLTLQQWETVHAVNLTGAFHCAQAAAELMLAQRRGHIINIASFVGRTGARGQPAYAAAKAGLLGLTLALAREWGPHNVQVNAVLPGVLATGMTQPLGPAALERFAQANVLGRLNTVDEVARFVVFVAGLENVSGQIFQLDSRIGRWT